jgi:hypothetical protein
MRFLFIVAASVAVTGFLSLAPPVQAQENPLLGTWHATDPDSGQQESLVITAETLQFGDGEPQIPYSAEGSGDVVSLHIGGGDTPPAVFTFTGENSAQLTIPGGPTIALTRVAAAPATAGAEAPPDAGPAPASLVDEIAAMMAPHGVQTRFEPLNQSLENLLSAGWNLDQAAGVQGGFTLLLTNGGAHALCILVPQDLGQASTALSDCRRLN